MFGVGADDGDDWHLRAECHIRREEVYSINKKLGYDIFYPEKGKTEEALKESKKFCRPCPVKLECLTEALDNEEAGTWGGESFKARRSLGRLRNTALLALQMQQRGLLQDENKDHNEASNPDPAA